MPLSVNFGACTGEDCLITVPMQPPVDISNWDISFNVWTHHGGINPLITKSCSSGFNGVSGISIINPGQGIFTINLDSVDTSGLDYKTFAYKIEHTNSGVRTALTEGFFTVSP